MGAAVGQANVDDEGGADPGGRWRTWKVASGSPSWVRGSPGCITPAASAGSSGLTSTGVTPSSSQRARKTSSTEAGVAVPAPSTQVRPRLMMAAFSPAIFSSVSPRMRMWSRPIPVTATPSMDFTALVASQRPPIPHSRTATSTPASAKTTQAATVMRSNSVTS